MSTHEQRGKPRSGEQRRRFFAVVAGTYHQWPEAHAFQPDNAEHLRSWLLVKAKHCVINTFQLESDAEAAQFAKLIPIITALMLKKHSWCRAKGDEIHVCVPLSISYEDCGHNLFTHICADVDEIIRTETGLDPEQILRERGA